MESSYGPRVDEYIIFYNFWKSGRDHDVTVYSPNGGKEVRQTSAESYGCVRVEKIYGKNTPLLFLIWVSTFVITRELWLIIVNVLLNILSVNFYPQQLSNRGASWEE
jgi:hypothetical protein